MGGGKWQEAAGGGRRAERGRGGVRTTAGHPLTALRAPAIMKTFGGHAGISAIPRTPCMCS